MPLTRRQLLLGGAACVCSGALGVYVGRETAPEVAARPTGTTGTSLLPTDDVGDRIRAQPNGVFNVDTDDPVVAMTFDDGPDPNYTPHVVQLLDRFDAKATFFSIGVNAVAHRDLLATQMKAGHSIGNHTLDHPDLEGLGPKEVKAQIDGGEQKLLEAGAPDPDFFRPPRGHTDDVVGIVADSDEYVTVFWTVCVEHFVLHRPLDQAVADMLAWVDAGSIILAHDGGTIASPDRPDVIDRSKTMEALPLVFEGLRKKGLHIVDIPTLFKAKPGPPDRDTRR